MKKVIFIGILSALILTLGECLAQPKAYSDNDVYQVRTTEATSKYAVVKFVMSVNGKISGVQIDKGDGMGFMPLRQLDGFLKPDKIRTEADLLNYMLDFNYQLAKTTVLTGKSQVYQFSVFEEIRK